MSTLITDFFKNVLSTLVPPVREDYKTLLQRSKGITFREKLSDLSSILKDVWVFLVFIILAVLAFTMLPQGKDVLLVVIEDAGINYHFANLIWLVIGVTCWSIVTEYGARYSIYVADNSGKNLSKTRVECAKRYKK